MILVSLFYSLVFAFIERGRPDFEGFLRPEAHLPTRLTQLGAAADLNLWSQCFQTAEDILALGLHELLQRSLSDKDSSLHKHRGLLLQQTAIFYEKLAMVISYIMLIFPTLVLCFSDFSCCRSTSFSWFSSSEKSLSYSPT